MQKSLKRALSLLLAVLMVTALFTALPLTVSAAETDAEAVGSIESGTVSGSITLGETKKPYLNSNSSFVFYSFTPDRDMKIAFYSSYSSTSYRYYNPYGVICDSSKNGLKYNSNYGSTYNFRVEYYVSAGNTYYLGARKVQGYDFSCPVTLVEIPLWEIDENGVITKYNGEASAVEVPTEVNGTAVTAIGASAFLYNSNIESVSIPACVTSIGADAFRACSNLATVTFAQGSGLTEIGSHAFAYCSELTTVNFDALTSLTTIGEHAFSGQSQFSRNKLTYVNLPEGLTSIGYGAFDYSGSGNGYLIVPSTVTYAGGSDHDAQTAFYMASYNTMIFKTMADCFAIDFDSALYVPYVACYENSDVESQLENGTNTFPHVDTAHHIKSPYTITYDANLPNGVNASVPQASEYTDDVITISDTVPTAGSKRTFLGWSFSPSGSAVNYQPGDTAAFCADVTLYAVWRDTVTFIDGGETVATKDIAVMDMPSSGTLSYNEVKAVSDGKVLMGYYTEPNGKGILTFVKSDYYSNDGVKMPEDIGIANVMDAADTEGEVKLYAYWQDAPQIAGESISLGGDVTTNFYIHLPAGTSLSDYQSAELKIGWETSFDLKDSGSYTYDAQSGMYKVAFKQYFKEMTNTNDITLRCNATDCSTISDYSIQSYAKGIIDGDHDAYFKSTYHYSDDKIANLKELCKAMLSLGAKAQLQFDYNTDNLANENLDYTAPALNPDDLVEPDYSVNGAKFHATDAFITNTSIKFINKGNWDKVFITYSYNGEYTSTEIKKTDEQSDGYDVYTYTMPEYISYTYIRFSDAYVEEDDYGYNEEHAYQNLTYESSYDSDDHIGCYYYPYSGSYNDYYGYTYWELSYNSPGSSASDIRFVNTQNWEHVYVWNAESDEEFPGTEMTFLETNKDGEKIYSAPRPGSSATLVFSDGTQANKTTSVKFATQLTLQPDSSGNSDYITLASNVIPMWKATPCDVFSDYGITHEGSNIGLLNQSAYGIILRNNSAAGLKVYQNGTEVEGTQIQMNLDDNYYYYRFYDIPARDITKDIQLTIHVDSVTDPVTGAVTNPADLTVSFNAISYIKRALCLEGENYAALRNVVTALYDFNQRALAFFGTN